MIKVPETVRTYQVARDDFPIEIEIQAKNLAFCQAVAAATQVRINGNVVEAIPVNVTEDSANLAIHFAISKPTRQPDLDLVQLIQCTFPDDAPANSSYGVTITSAKNDVEKTTGKPPTYNPRNIALTFFYRTQ